MNEIYLKITDNIIDQFKSFKKGESDSKRLNSNFLLQLSSLFKYKANGKNSENTKQKFEGNTGDVYIPLTRLEKSMQMKFKEKESNLEEENYFEVEMDHGKNKFAEESKKYQKYPDQTLDLDSEFKDVNESHYITGKNQKDPLEFNPCESFRTISVFSNNENNNYLDNNFENILDKT